MSPTGELNPPTVYINAEKDSRTKKHVSPKKQTKPKKKETPKMRDTETDYRRSDSEGDPRTRSNLKLNNVRASDNTHFKHLK